MVHQQKNNIINIFPNDNSNWKHDRNTLNLHQKVECQLVKLEETWLLTMQNEKLRMQYTNMVGIDK